MSLAHLIFRNSIRATSSTHLLPCTGSYWQSQQIQALCAAVPLRTMMTGAFWRTVSQAFSRMRMRRYHLIIAPIIGGGCVSYLCAARMFVGSCVSSYVSTRTAHFLYVDDRNYLFDSSVWECADRNRTKPVPGRDVFLAPNNCSR